MSQLTIIMYHYVRDIKKSRYPNIKGLEASGFRRQLDYLRDNFNIIKAEDVIACAKDGKPLPKKSCFLTFDDGFKDHIKYVLPELLTRNIQGAFFPPVKPVVEREILDVHRIHFILATTNDHLKLVDDVNSLSLDRGVSEIELASYRDEYFLPSRFDIAEVMYVKHMLQHVLPESIRNDIATVLFEKYAERTERDFAEELYLSVDETKSLVGSGMYVGSHGYLHRWLNKENIDLQRSEIDASLKFLKYVGARTEDWIMCYPYGAYNSDTLSVLKERKCVVGLTTKIGTAEVTKSHALELSRYDTNDFPQ